MYYGYISCTCKTADILDRSSGQCVSDPTLHTRKMQSTDSTSCPLVMRPCYVCADIQQHWCTHLFILTPFFAAWLHSVLILTSGS